MNNLRPKIILILLVSVSLLLFAFVSYFPQGSTTVKAQSRDETIVQTVSSLKEKPGLLAPEGAIAGQVVEQGTNTPIANAQIYVLDMKHDTVGEAHSQANGTYTVGVPPGTYKVAVAAAGYGGVFYGGYDDPAAIPVVVKRYIITMHIDFVLAPEATMSGVVYEAGGTTPIAGAQIQVWPFNGGIIRQAISAADGSYTVHGLSTGEFVAKAEANNYATEFYNNAISWGSATPINVLQPNQTPGIDFTLEPAGTIAGSIYNEDGSALLGDVMFGFASTASPGSYTTWCTAGGEFTRPLPLGSYKVFAQGDETYCGGDPHYAREYWQEKESWKDAQVVTLTAASPDVTGLTFTLSPGGSISGTARDQGTSEPLNEAGIWAISVDNDNRYHARTGTDGKYLLGGLLPGTYRLNASSIGYAQEWYNEKSDYAEADDVIVVAQNNTSGIDFTLEPVGTIAGSIYNTSGSTLISNVKFGFASTTVPGNFTTYCTNDGKFNHTLPLGSYKLFALGDNIDCGGNPDYVLEYWQEKESWEEAEIITLTKAAPIVKGIYFTLDLITSTVILSDTGGSLGVEMGTITTVLFPPGAVTETVEVTLRTSPTAAKPDGYGLLGVGFKLTAETEQGEPVNSFSEMFTITVSYDTEDAMLLKETSLSFYFWDVDASQWVRMPSTVDTENKNVTAQLDHLTEFAVFGEAKPANYLPMILNDV